jgi:hypothetical protein
MNKQEEMPLNSSLWRSQSDFVGNATLFYKNGSSEIDLKTQKKIQVKIITNLKLTTTIRYLII